MEWLTTINQGTVIIVPTRGLQHSLSKQYAEQQVSAGKTAWQSPQILVWEDYIDQLWNKNKHSFEKAYIRIDNTQAQIVWRKIVLESKKSDSELLLLNEQQTANVVQNSWKLSQRWQIDINQNDHLSDIDSVQFSQWCDAYQQKLKKNNWIDSAQVERLVVDKTTALKPLSSAVIFAYFDLLTFNQKKHIRLCRENEIAVQTVAMQDVIDTTKQKTNYHTYSTEQQEWRTALRQSRLILENKPEANIAIIIPSLAEHRAEVEQLARQEFYPNLTPLEAHQQALVYRFSIGQSLYSVAYIYSMLNALELLKNKFSYQSFSYLLMSEWWCFRHSVHIKVEHLIQLDLAVKKQRLTWLSWQDVLQISEKYLPEVSELHEKIQQLIEFGSTDVPAKTTHSAKHWQSIFSQWFSLLDFPNNQLDSWHYQAHESWLASLDDFIGYDLVQGEMGLTRALSLLNTLCKDKVYMRQAKDEPILISGVLEGIGHQVDHLFVTGMDENYPPSMSKDPFLNNQNLARQGYPFSDKNAELEYEKNKLNSLLAGSDNVSISYSHQFDGLEVSESALLRNTFFESIESNDIWTSMSTGISSDDDNIFEEYIDINGLECLQSGKIVGGSKVFENQSQCPFKAYIEHRVLRNQIEDPEFGLDARDTGTLVHELLESLWRELQSSSILNSLQREELQLKVDQHVDNFLQQSNSRFLFDRKELLKLEQARLKGLLLEWLMFEKENRFLAFSVIGQEREMYTEFANIPVKLVIDRIDKMDNGDCVVIDYKTGNTNRSDWKGERLKNPQLPLYALALEQKANLSIKGIAFAQVKSQACAFEGITEIEHAGEGLKNYLEKDIPWSEQMTLWHENLTALADEFLQGHAIVDPSKAKPCQYCDLQSVCRIYQLKNQSGQNTDDIGSEA